MKNIKDSKNKNVKSQRNIESDTETQERRS